ncbi:MAG: ATP-binding protein [Chloroflexota bacterium]
MTSVAAQAIEPAWLTQAETRARALEQSDALKSALPSSVSHELRSPLTTIKASVRSLRAGEVPPDTKGGQDLLAAIAENADHLNLLVRNLLDMSRIEAGTLLPQRSWNVLAEIVRSVVCRMRTVTREHSLRIEVSEDLPLVPVDFVQIEEVFTNLIGNSVKYSPAGTTITIAAEQSSSREVLVQVKNMGPWLEPEHVERNFGKFYRVTAADRVPGTGLGLSICKGIITAHG